MWIERQEEVLRTARDGNMLRGTDLEEWAEVIAFAKGYIYG